MLNGVFWFSWSEEQWTAEVRKQHEQADWRSRYMQKFDMDAWLTTHQRQQALPFDTLTHTVAEYSQALSHSKIKSWSPFPLKKIKPYSAATLQHAAQALDAKNAAILVLDDPVGVVMEISALTRYRLGQDFTSNPKYRRGMALTMMINSLELGLRSQVQSALKDYTQSEEQKIRYGQSAIGDGPVFPQPKMADEYKALTDSKLQEWVDNTWQDYEKYIDREKMQAFNEKLQADLTTYNQNTIVPITQMYLNWLQSQVMTAYFVHHFDTTSPHSGVRYIRTVFNCLAGMTDKAGVIKYIDNQLNQDALTRENYLLRAVFFNNDAWANKVDTEVKAVSGANWYWDISWDRLADALKDFNGKYAGWIQLELEKLSHLFVYSLFKATGQISQGMPVRLAVALLVAQGKAIIPVTVVANLKSYVLGLTRGMAALLDMSARSGGQLYNTLKPRMEKLLQSTQGNLMVNKQLPVAIDIEEARKLSQLPKAERLKQLSKVAMTEDDTFRRMFPAAFRSAVAQSEGMSAGALAEAVGGGKVPLAGSFFSATFQLTAVLTTDRPTEWEGWARLNANGAMALAAVMEALKRALTPAAKLDLPTFISRPLGKVLQFTSLSVWDTVGYAGGVVYAGLEFFDGFRDFNRGEYDIGIAHLISGTGVGLVTAAAGSEITIRLLAGFGIVEASMAEGTVLVRMLGSAGIIIGVLLILGAGAYLLLHTRDNIQKWLLSTQWRRIPPGESDIPTMSPEEQELGAYNNLFPKEEGDHHGQSV